MKCVIFNLDQVIVESSIVQECREKGDWSKAYSLIPKTKIHEGLSSVFEYIRKQDIKVALISDAPFAYIRDIRHFHSIPAYLILSYINPYKEQNIIAYARELFKVDAENIFSFSGKTIDIKASNEAGIRSVACLWGAGEDHDLFGSGYDYIIEDPKHIKDIVSRLLFNEGFSWGERSVKEYNESYFSELENEIIFRNISDASMYYWNEELKEMSDSEKRKLPREAIKKDVNILNPPTKTEEISFDLLYEQVKREEDELNETHVNSLKESLEKEYNYPTTKRTSVQEINNSSTIKKSYGNIETPKLLQNKVNKWFRLNNNFPYLYGYYYYPTTCQNTEITEEDWEVRKLVWNFKNKVDSIRPQAKDMANWDVMNLAEEILTNTFQEYVEELTLFCIPASSYRSNMARYEEFSDMLCKRMNMKNSFNYVRVIKSGHPKHLGGDGTRQFEVDYEFFKGKNILLFDDIITSGKSMIETADFLNSINCNVVAGLSIAKTKHIKENYSLYDIDYY